MTDEGGQPAPTDTIQELKEMFQQQFAELKAQNEETVKQLNDTIAQLKADNASLQAAVVRSASMEPSVQAPEKTPEEIYREEVDRLKGKALEYVKKEGNYR